MFPFLDLIAGFFIFSIIGGLACAFKTVEPRKKPTRKDSKDG